MMTMSDVEFKGLLFLSWGPMSLQGQYSGSWFWFFIFIDFVIDDFVYILVNLSVYLHCRNSNHVNGGGPRLPLGALRPLVSYIRKEPLAFVPSATNERNKNKFYTFTPNRFHHSLVSQVLYSVIFLAEPYYSTTHHCSHYGEEEILKLSQEEGRI